LYVDEDAMDGDLVRGLRSRGIDVVTAAEASMIRAEDEKHLSLATDQGRVLYSLSVADFHEIHKSWLDWPQPFQVLAKGTKKRSCERGENVHQPSGLGRVWRGILKVW
jgi:hypothetical protein